MVRTEQRFDGRRLSVEQSSSLMRGEGLAGRLALALPAECAGVAKIFMGTAGVILNARVGDPAYGWAADHVEPAVSIRNREDGPEHALHYLACIGNSAVMTSGIAKGARGVVTGEHAHILVDFPPDILEKICIGDQVLIRAIGMGLEMLDYPDISVRKMSPELFDALRIEELGDGRIRVPVAAEIPGYLMGSGAELGADYVDQDMMTNDRETLAALGLDNLRIGDILAVRDHDHTRQSRLPRRRDHDRDHQPRRLLHDRTWPRRHGSPLLRHAEDRARDRQTGQPGRLPGDRQSRLGGRAEETRVIETNEDRVITMSVMGVVISPSYPGIPAIPHQIDREGKPRLLPALGGIVYNVKVGDSVYGWAGDMIEPGVAIKSPDPRPMKRSMSLPASATTPW